MPRADGAGRQRGIGELHQRRLAGKHGRPQDRPNDRCRETPQHAVFRRSIERDADRRAGQAHPGVWAQLARNTLHQPVTGAGPPARPRPLKHPRRGCLAALSSPCSSRGSERWVGACGTRARGHAGGPAPVTYSSKTVPVLVSVCAPASVPAPAPVSVPVSVPVPVSVSVSVPVSVPVPASLGEV